MSYRQWTEAEWAIIDQYLDGKIEAPPAQGKRGQGYTTILAPLLPGRSEQDIRNGTNMRRRSRLGICQCGTKLPPSSSPTSRCTACTDKAKTARKLKLANGLCASCSDPLDQLGSSATLCPKCRKRRQSHRPKDIKRFKKANPNRRPKNDPLASHRIIPWPACGHSRWIAEFAGKTGRPIIDLFGGTGELLRLVTVFQGKVHAYYDRDPIITNLVAHAVQNVPLTPEANALFLEGANHRRTRSERHRRLQVLGQALNQNTTIECRDALDVLAHAHLEQPANAIFLCDPPWPGSSDHTRYNFKSLDYPALLDGLLDLPEGQDFILSLGAERQALELAFKHLGPGATLFWRTSGPTGSKSIIALSPRLCFAFGAQGQELGMPIDPEAYGFR